MNFKESQTEQKLRGGYYTPGYLADFLVNWVSGTHPERVLEPSCGDGAFLSQLSKDNPFVNVLGFELDAKEASKARRHVFVFPNGRPSLQQIIYALRIYNLSMESSVAFAACGIPQGYIRISSVWER